MRHFNRTGSAPGSNPARRNKCCRLVTLEADSPGNWFVFRNDFPMNLVCAVLGIPVQFPILFLDLRDPVCVHTVVPDKIFHDFFAAILSKCCAPTIGHSIQFRSVVIVIDNYLAGPTIPRKQEGISFDQLFICCFLVQYNSPCSSDIKCALCCRPSRNALCSWQYRGNNRD